MTETLERTISTHRKLEEEMRDSNEKKDAVAHWEAQIAEIIQWYVLLRPFTPKGAKYQNSRKIQNFICKILKNKMVPCKRTVKEVSFEWSHVP